MKQNLTRFTWNKLLYCLWSNKAKVWSCSYSKTCIALLCWACIWLFCIMHWLCCLSSTSLFFSLQVSWAKFVIMFKFFLKKICLFWPTLSTLFLYYQCQFHLAPYFFFSLQIFLLLWLLFLEPFFFFSIFDCLFWVLAFLLRLLVYVYVVKQKISSQLISNIAPKCVAKI